MPYTVAVVGGGPAGLMAAEVLAAGKVQVEIYEAMGSLGRKFLLAGRGGLNLTHTEPWRQFIRRYGSAEPFLGPVLAQFNAEHLRDWVEALGHKTFVGSSGRVFPEEFKASPILRSWLRRLHDMGVLPYLKHRWTGWDPGERRLHFRTPGGELMRRVDAVVLALGGGSWPQLGSDGSWVPLLKKHGISINPLQASNCGFDIAWSPYFVEHYAGHALKRVVARCRTADHELRQAAGECLVTRYGIEGGVIYALSALLREQCNSNGTAELILDLVPDKTPEQIAQCLNRPRGSNTVAKHLQRHLHITGAKFGLLREQLTAEALRDPEQVAPLLKSLPLQIRAPRPLREAISSAGGICFEELDPSLMLCKLPGIFCAGEMLDWEAPTGGYLLSACLASGRYAAHGALAWLNSRKEVHPA